MELELTALRAITDFNENNGATRVVVGSHGRHQASDPPPKQPSQTAVMSAGSVLFFTGSVWHGARPSVQRGVPLPNDDDDDNDDDTDNMGRVGFLVQQICGY